MRTRTFFLNKYPQKVKFRFLAPLSTVSYEYPSRNGGRASRSAGDRHEMPSSLSVWPS